MGASKRVPSSSETIRYGAARPVVPSILENGDSAVTDEARRSMKVEMVEPKKEEPDAEAEPATKPEAPAGEADSPADLELSPSASDDKKA